MTAFHRFAIWDFIYAEEGEFRGLFSQTVSLIP